MLNGRVDLVLDAVEYEAFQHDYEDVYYEINKAD